MATVTRGHVTPCLKARYRDREEARAALRLIQENSKREVVPIRIYPYGRCHGYHLTSRDPVPSEEFEKAKSDV